MKLSFFVGPSRNSATEVMVVPFRVARNALAVFYGTDMDWLMDTQAYVRLINKNTRAAQEGYTFVTDLGRFGIRTVMFIKDQTHADVFDLTLTCIELASKNGYGSIQLPLFRTGTEASDAYEALNAQAMINGANKFRWEHDQSPLDVRIRLSQTQTAAMVMLGNNAIPNLGTWDEQTKSYVAA